MKRIILSLFLAGITATAFAQGCPITVTVPVSEPGTGLTSIEYNFTGVAGRTYTFTSVEVDFDDDGVYQPIPEAYLNGDYPSVGSTTAVLSGITTTTFSGTIEWNGAASFPDRYHEQTRVRITAQHFLSGGGVTDIDGNDYPTVIIGDQEWMAENLRVTRDANGSDITRYCYNDDPDWCELYGGLYTWDVVMNGENSSNDNPSGVQGVCPEGWHVPSESEWLALFAYVESQGFPNDHNDNPSAGNALKSCRKGGGPSLDCCDTDEHPRWDAHDTHYGFDEFGFSALPGGYRWSSDNSFSFIQVGLIGHWWSATENSSETDAALNWYMSIASGGVIENPTGNKANGFSVRCVKD